ncbi:MAG: Asp-tRNA(Asn)/Glu-tRNA(Gln) amidotransferase subunit GatC [bacterium JZ-2024 1]
MTKEEFEQLLWLSRLSLPEEEKERFFAQIQEILEHIRRIESVPVEEFVEYFYPNQEKRELREDKKEPANFSELALSNAPERVGDFFACPSVLPTAGGESHELPGADEE